MTIDSITVSDEECPIAEVGHLHETDKNPFTVDASKTRSGHVRCVQDFAMLSVCTCGDSILDEEVATYQDVIQCKKAGCVVARQNGSAQLSLAVAAFLPDSKSIHSTISIVLDYSTLLTVGCVTCVSRAVELGSIIGCSTSTSWQLQTGHVIAIYGILFPC
jgi:hypothetical protein